MGILILVILSISATILPFSQARSTVSLKYEREGKFLFNIIQFKNEPCRISDKEIGICYRSDECAAKGGQARSTCAAGFGSCCLFKAATGSTTVTFDAPVSYFTNPNYPQTDWTPNYITFTAKVSNPDVCQLRLDFETFVLSGPSLLTSPFGHCNSDKLVIFATQQQQQLGLSGGNELCGDMTGQHLYINVNASGEAAEDFVRLFAMVGLNSMSTDPNDGLYGIVSNYSWNIRVTQIDCTKNDPLQAPSGCLQYFTEPSGSIESFNFRMAFSPYPANLDYAICIRKQSGFCGVNFGTNTLGDEFKMNQNGAFMSTPPFGQNCYDYTGSKDSRISSDYLAILGAYTYSGFVPVETAHICGKFDGTSLVFPGAYTSYPGPVVINVHTDGAIKGVGNTGPANSSAEAIQIVNAGFENGFRLTYTQSSNCIRTP